MQVVEGCDQLQFVRHQQAVTEHVTGHIADAYHCDAVFLHVDAALTEVTLYTYPRALGGDAHFLVVVTSRTTGGERIAQPEAVVDGNAIGDVGEGRSALVRRHHQVGVIVVMTHDVGRRHQRAVFQVVGDVQQAGNEDAVAGDAFGRDLVMDVTVDPHVVGGIRVQVGDDVVDGSMASRLHDLQRRMAG